MKRLVGGSIWLALTLMVGLVFAPTAAQAQPSPPPSSTTSTPAQEVEEEVDPQPYIWGAGIFLGVLLVVVIIFPKRRPKQPQRQRPSSDDRTMVGRHHDDTQLLSGRNKYCLSCGEVNPPVSLTCSRCGADLPKG